MCLNGEPLYCANIKGHDTKRCGDGVNVAFSTKPHSELLDFAKMAIQRIQVRCPSLLWDGLFRVDVMQPELVHLL